ncbi:sel1 repeat family protein [Neisseria bacilliformis]|nr:sel1 repeat family protein [Neisseria bacilliformis]
MMNHEVLKTAEELLDNLEVDKALPLVQSLAGAGVTEAYGMLAYIYDYKHQNFGSPDEQTVAAAYGNYYAALEQDFRRGNLRAGMKLAGALRFHAANHIAKDDQKALLIYQQCAAEGWDEAAITLAEIYKTGDLGVEADFGRCISLLASAAEKGNAQAMHELGILLLPNHRSRALDWIAKAAQKGYWQSVEYIRSARQG